MENLKNLSNILESILFAAGNPVPVAVIAEKLGVAEDDVRKASEELRARYGESGGIRLLSFNKKLQLSSNPDYKDYIGAVLNPIKEREFTKTILECAAIIAYKQPITKGELEALRGLNCDYAVHTLLDLKMIEPVGRKDAVGRPILYVTTDNFLKRFHLNSIEDLPDYDTLMENIAKLHESEQDSYLYANHVYVDAEGDAPQEGQPAAEQKEQGGKESAPSAEEELPDFLQDLGEDLIKIE